MEHPDLNLLIHESKRNERSRRHQLPPDNRSGFLSTLRARTGNALIAMGTHIAPTPAPRRPIHSARHAAAAGS